MYSKIAAFILGATIGVPICYEKFGTSPFWALSLLLALLIGLPVLCDIAGREALGNHAWALSSKHLKEGRYKIKFLGVLGDFALFDVWYFSTISQDLESQRYAFARSCFYPDMEGIFDVLSGDQARLQSTTLAVTWDPYQERFREVK